MSDRDERERIREQKKRELLNETEGAGATDGDAPASPVHVDGADHLDELAADNDLLLVDFYADWCGPCKMMEPAIEAVAAESPATVAKVDVDAHQELAGQYGVRGVPTLVLFSDGEVVDQQTGALQREGLERFVGQHA